MFSFVRVVSVISFLLVMCAVLIFGHEFKQVASEDLIAIVESSNASMARNFKATTWKKYREQLAPGLQWYRKFRASNVPPSQWQNYSGYKEMTESFSKLNALARDLFKDFEDSPIAAVNILTIDNIPLVSVNQSQMLTVPSITSITSSNVYKDGDDADFGNAIQGRVSNTVLTDMPYVLPGDGKDSARGTLIRGFFPIFSNDGVPAPADIIVDCGKSSVNCQTPQNGKQDIDIVLELRYDVSKQWNQLEFFHHISVYGVMGVFSLIILMMLFTSGKAESIIAKQHEANLELAAQASSAQAENRDKSQFLANVSHELRTPLNAIIGFSEFIKSERSGKIGNEKYAEYIRDIHGSGVHLLSLINDILDYSKAEADKLELDVAEVDATKLVKNSMRLVSPRAENAQVELIEEIPREHFTIETDAKKLKQVMLNLLSNSVKFTPSNGSVTVAMWQNVVDGGLSIEVRDTGIGIAPKDISRAMAPFGQVDNTLSRKYEGTGLGLPLTRKFVEIMGGTFTIASEVGKGTTITISLPKKPKGKGTSSNNMEETAPQAMSAETVQQTMPQTGMTHEHSPITQPPAASSVSF